MKAFEIDFVRQIIIQTIEKEHIKNPTKFIGGSDNIALTSFYEHLASEDEINRYVETVRDLTEQQNRTGLMANGTIILPENPTYTNISNGLIIPMSFTINFRTTLGNRDLVKETMNNVVKVLKGRKQDIAELDNGKLFMVGTMFNNVVGLPRISIGDYLGEFHSNALTSEITTKLNALGFSFDYETTTQHFYCYYEDLDTHKLCVVLKNNDSWEQIEDDGNYDDVIFPPEHDSFEKYKVSMAFDSFRCSEPRTLNAEDYCDLSFGGSATLVSEHIKLGNELTKLALKQYMIKGADSGSDLYFDSATNTWLEPLEMPSGTSQNGIPYQLMSNGFRNLDHTESIAPTLQYTFIYDDSVSLLKKLYRYARYGIVDISGNGVSPNMVFLVSELYSSWGNTELESIYAKLVGNIDIENTESDTLSISLSLQVMGNQ